MKLLNINAKAISMLTLAGMMAACTHQSEAKPVDPLQHQIDSAKSILAARAQTATQQINVISAENVIWPNGAAGCPRPGVNYTQALVPGYKLVLELDGREFHYHGVNGGEPFYCAKPGPKSGWIQDR